MYEYGRRRGAGVYGEEVEQEREELKATAEQHKAYREGQRRQDREGVGRRQIAMGSCG